MLKAVTKTKRLFSAADLKIKPFDAADYLTSPAMIDGYLKEVMATGDPAIIQKALGAIARARGMTKVAKATGLSRKNLYRLLSAPHKANFSTVMRVANALGYALTFKRKGKARKEKVHGDRSHDPLSRRCSMS